MAFTTYKTWAVGDVLTASDMNTYVRDNGNHIYGSTWTTFSPTLTQSGSVTLTTATGRYRYFGYLCHLYIYLDPSGTGTGANDIVIGNIPAAIAPRASGRPATGGDTPSGIGYYMDTGSALYTIAWYFATSSTLKGVEMNTISGAELGTSPNIAVAAADFLTCSIVYETASAST